MKHSFLRDLFRNCRELYYYFNDKPRGLGYILMLHRIGEPNPNRLPQSEELKVSIQHIEKFIIEAKEKFDIIKLEDVPNRIKEKHKKKFIVFTFDDGYKEVLSTGLPIFRRYNVPFTVFLNTGFLEKNAVLWWDILERILLSHDFIKLSNGNYYSLKTRVEKIDAFNHISLIIKNLNKNRFFEELTELFNEYDIDWYADTNTSCLQWNDIYELLSCPLFTLGTHTHSHFKLDNLQSEKDVEEEIMKAVTLIKERTGVASIVFAYPYGGAEQREFEVLRSHNSSKLLAVLAHGGPVTSETLKLEQLPRINFDNSVEVKDLLHQRNVYMGIF